MSQAYVTGADGATLRGVKGLSEVNRRLLNQYGSHFSLSLGESFSELIKESFSEEKQYCFHLIRKSRGELVIVFLKSKENNAGKETQQLAAIQSELETALKAKNIEYAVKLTEKNNELTINAAKEIIDTIAELLCCQGFGLKPSLIKQHTRLLGQSVKEQPTVDQADTLRAEINCPLQ